jgi:hypothetical protein
MRESVAVRASGFFVVGNDAGNRVRAPCNTSENAIGSPGVTATSPTGARTYPPEGPPSLSAGTD